MMYDFSARRPLVVFLYEGYVHTRETGVSVVPYISLRHKICLAISTRRTRMSSCGTYGKFEIYSLDKTNHIDDSVCCWELIEGLYDFFY